MSRTRGLTLIEMLVVIGIVLMLLAILMPALQAARDMAYRTTCATNLRQIHMGVTTYAADHRSVLPPARQRRFQTELHEDTARLLRDVGLVQGSGDVLTPSDVWQCPTVEGFDLDWSAPESGGYFIGYQYMGGIETWRNDQGEFESRSPERLDRAQNEWVLAADTTVVNSRALSFPQRVHSGRDGAPAGHNQATVDGSVRWIERDRLIFIHTGESVFAGMQFMHQEDVGDEFDAAAAQRMSDFVD